ncbi:hypothetical protein AN477_20685 [Alicyclobacillus ferrooxydans]|uniref:Uncharacterized protein n=1 Tax=Alicyclobacillus ferrooxydans TaxID=471514 RepID=A0A0P9CF40_9BACL|nr:hypothetical protein AN477_20685 [Alicyclobacillus ferrooxydans]
MRTVLVDSRAKARTFYALFSGDDTGVRNFNRRVQEKVNNGARQTQMDTNQEQSRMWKAALRPARCNRKLSGVAECLLCRQNKGKNVR